MSARMALGVLIPVLVCCGGSTSRDAGPDASSDAAMDASSDAPVDAPVDASGAADSTPMASWPACTADVLDGIDRDGISPPGRDSDAFVPSTAAERAATVELVAFALAGDVPSAIASAAAAGYETCAEGDLLRARPSAPGAGRAVFVLRLRGARSVVVAAPHAWHEVDTLAEARSAFVTLSARALVVSGSHRCASPERSACDGVTSVCDASALPFRRSDAAHAVDTDFHAVHEALFAHAPGDVFVNLHGMGADGLRVSNGTRDPVLGDSVLARFAAALVTQYPAEPVSACSAGAGVALGDTLCGTTNVQGRLVNGSSDACDQNPASAAGAFLHVEQSRGVRAAFDGVVAALDATVPR
jgi:hypothetical protein